MVVVVVVVVVLVVVVGIMEVTVMVAGEVVVVEVVVVVARALVTVERAHGGVKSGKRPMGVVLLLVVRVGEVVLKLVEVEVRGVCLKIFAMEG